MQMKPSQEQLNVKKPALLPRTIDVLSFATSAQALRSPFSHFKTNELPGLVNAELTLSLCSLREMTGDMDW